jgi:UDP-N-acetylmuramyl pentapeptide phosphotransferase/UDP-N-acetylglucosamine-1-phosphate transferase
MVRPRRVARPLHRAQPVATALGAAASTALLLRVLRRRPPGGTARWTRTNHAGAPVTLLEGPAYAVGAVCGALATGGAGAAPAAVAGLGAAAFGALDDLAGDSASKGLRGHLGALASGRVTTGAVKILGLGLTGAATAALADRQRPADVPVLATVTGAAVVAAAANMANLLDLRPGRALKVALLAATPLAATPLAAGRGAGTRSRSAAALTAAAAAGAALGALPGDLAGTSMLGDTGANSAGALVGLALVGRTGLRGRLAALALLTALTLASEKVSFTAVIEATPGLRELDALGRRPAR